MPHTSSGRGKARFGDLERALLDVLWGPEASPRDRDERLTVRAVHEELGASRDAAYTTVMTVLDRMVAKGLVERTKEGRTNRYRAGGSRSEMTAELMREAMSELVDTDRRSTLVAFVGEASEDERAALRAALADLEPSD